MAKVVVANEGSIAFLFASRSEWETQPSQTNALIKTTNKRSNIDNHNHNNFNNNHEAQLQQAHCIGGRDILAGGRKISTYNDEALSLPDLVPCDTVIESPHLLFASVRIDTHTH